MNEHQCIRSSKRSSKECEIKGRMDIYTHVKKKGEIISQHVISTSFKNHNFSFSFKGKALCQKIKGKEVESFLSIILHMIVNVISYFRDKRFSLFYRLKVNDKLLSESNQKCQMLSN